MSARLWVGGIAFAAFLWAGFIALLKSAESLKCWWRARDLHNLHWYCHECGGHLQDKPKHEARLDRAIRQHRLAHGHHGNVYDFEEAS